MKDPIEELLVITMEECGELIQACSKMIRNPLSENVLENLVEEAGDVQCMVELLQEFDLVSWKSIEKRVNIKRNKLKKWSSLIGDSSNK
jgi:NTP pyrophosphatase (non-canonical NTP hydrolase)|tara:strand:+ start:86 stop:352 length:267 start_codon:yes stop_codon:yes gene_type:complete